MKANRILMMASLAALAYTAGAQMNPKEKMAAALKAIQDNYVDSLGEEKLSDAAIIGMMKELDPHSKYFTREEGLQMRQSMSGSFYGLGIQYMVQNDSLYVTQVFPGGPAAEKGLLPGDRITAINSKPVSGRQVTNLDIMKTLRGEKGSEVSVDILRKASQPFNVSITRGSVPDNSVTAAYMVNDTVGYIALRIFNGTTRNEIDKALSQLKAAGMQSLILDLQGNGGGYVEAAIGVADEFLAKDRLVFYSMPRDRGKDYHYTGGYGQFYDGKLVVMIDQNTASASEILSGALQDWDRAVLVGRRSFGKGLMQHPVELPDGSVMELTGARYYTPSNRSIQKPYRGAKYSDDVTTRFASGELTDASVIHFPDSLKFTTLANKRTVYGGGGIMPDKFVAIDTAEYNGWLQNVMDAGLVNKPAFNYVDKERATLLNSYPQFAAFLTGFTTPTEIVSDVVNTAEKAGLKLNSTSADHLRQLLALEIKAQIASLLYLKKDYYIQVINNGNESFKQALAIIQNNAEYNKLLAVPVVKSKKK